MLFLRRRLYLLSGTSLYDGVSVSTEEAGMRVQTVRSLCRSGLVACSAAVIAVPPGPANSAPCGLWSPLLAYGGLTLLAFMSFPRSRRADLAGGLLSITAALESMRAMALWHGPAELLQSVAAVALVYALSFTEGLRSAAREASTSRFDLSGGRRRRRPSRPFGSLDAVS